MTGEGAAANDRPALRTRGRASAEAALAFALATVVLFMLRPELAPVHIALGYLMVVLLASARGGGRIGGSTAVVAFLAFNFLFLPPFYTFTIAEPRDWIVLFAFLATALTAARLLARAQAEAARASARAAELDGLAQLGAESIGAPRAEDALRSIERLLSDTLGVETCRVLPLDEATSITTESMTSRAVLRRTVQERREAGAVLASGVTRLLPLDELIAASRQADASALHVLCVPLFVRQQLVGVLELLDERGFTFAAPQERYLAVLTVYAALALERSRLSVEAERASALREAGRVKDAVLAAVSHDLRTPLTTIRALGWQVASDGDERGLLITEESDRLNTLVADLLALSQLRAGALTVRPELNALEDVLGVVLQRFSVTAPDRDVRVALDVREPILVGRYDEAHTLRILTNLVENAHRHAPPGTAIDVIAAHEGDVISVRVSDRGPGVPMDLRERLFEPFVRGDARDTRGAGLGLAIASGLAAAQGGSLTYAPRPEGGSEFCLRLPAADPHLP